MNADERIGGYGCRPLADLRRSQSTASALPPQWEPRALSAPWWEGVVYPCVPTCETAPSTGPNPANSHGGDVQICRGGQTVFGKGGASVMARIVAVLSTLAALFLVVGASAKY